MISSLALATVLAPPIRGAVIDAVIDSSAPTVNAGREFFSAVGPGKALLIQDQGLWFTGRGPERVTEGKLILTVTAGAPTVKAVRIISRPWEEGAGGQANPLADTVGVTWRQASAGSSWAGAGGIGEGDSEAVEGWKASQQGRSLVIEGLGSAVARLAAGDPTAWGLRLEFEGEGRLASAESLSEGPRFEVKTQAGGASVVIENAVPAELPEPGKAWGGGPVRVRLSNRGNMGSAPSQLRASWPAGGSVPVPSLQPGEEFTATIPVGAPLGTKDPLKRVVLSVEGESHSQSFWMHPNGIRVFGQFAAETSDKLNRWILPQSRFSFAQSGVEERFLAVPELSQAEIDFSVADRHVEELVAKAIDWKGSLSASTNGVTLDSRDERLAIPGVPLPPLGWPSRFADDTPMPFSGLLGRYEAARLQFLSGVRGEARKAWRPNLPKGLVLRLFDGSGRPLDSEAVTVVRPVPGAVQPQVLAKLRSMNTGGLFLSPSLFDPPAEAFFRPEDPAHDSIELIVGANGREQTLVVTKADLIAEGVRGGAAAALEFRVPMPKGIIDRSQNLALNRPVEDSAGSFPAQLVGVVDGRKETAVPMVCDEEGTNWLEIDLGRDRVVGEIELAFALAPQGIRISSYGTSQPPTSAGVWVEDQGLWFRQQGGRVVYRGASTLMRYIRIAGLGKGTAGLAEVVVRPLQAAAEPQAPPAR